MKDLKKLTIGDYVKCLNKEGYFEVVALERRDDIVVTLSNNRKILATFDHIEDVLNNK